MLRGAFGRGLPSAVEKIRGDALYRQQLLDFLEARMRREIGRVQRRIEVVKGAGEVGRRGATSEGARCMAPRGGGAHAEIHQQAKPVLLRGGVDVELGGLRD